MERLFFILCVSLFLFGCNDVNSSKEKHQASRNNIINVNDKVVEIPMEDVLISGFADLEIMNEYLIVKDWKTIDKFIYIFDKNTFKCLANVVSMGQGPNEIANMGNICIDEKNGKFYVFDNGKRKLFSFDLDSVLSAPLTYEFQTKADFNRKLYPYKCHYINDTLSVALVVEVIDNYREVNELAGTWNMKTGEVKVGYENPKVKTKRIVFSASKEQDVYVKCYSHYDLMTICRLDGTLKYNVYGPKWEDRKTNICHYNMDVRIGNDKIYALYAGVDHRSPERYPSKILVFDINGDYIKTLETGYHILHFCYDKDNHRLILYTNDEMQFGYLDLAGIV